VVAVAAIGRTSTLPDAGPALTIGLSATAPSSGSLAPQLATKAVMAIPVANTRAVLFMTVLLVDLN
jgi:hypothetical protein